MPEEMTQAEVDLEELRLARELRELEIANKELDIRLAEQQIRLAPLRLALMGVAMLAGLGWLAVLFVSIFGSGSSGASGG